MQLKNVVAISAIALTVSLGCNSNKEESATSTSHDYMKEPGETTANKPVAVDQTKGIGKFKDIKLTHPLDEAMVGKGKSTYDVKCGSCHKLTGEKLVGPGWKGVTDRRTPEWIMNFVTNTEEMINKDVEAQKMVEQCMVKMPNQNLSEEDARNVLEFMRKNDGKS